MVRLTDRLDMTRAVDCYVKPQTKFKRVLLMFKLMDKKIITFLHTKSCLNRIYGPHREENLSSTVCKQQRRRPACAV